MLDELGGQIDGSMKSGIFDCRMADVCISQSMPVHHPVDVYPLPAI